MKSIKKTLKRGLAVFLCLVMSMGILQTSALAAYEWRTVTLRPTSGLNLTTKVSVGDTVRSYNGNASYTVKEIKSQYGERTTIVLNAYLNNNSSFYFPKATDLWNVPSGKAVDYVYWTGNGSGKKTENGSGLTSNGAAGANVGTGVYYFKNVTPPSVTYTLNYNANGGAGAPAAQTGSSTTGSYTFTISSTVPTKTGYTFKGWSTSSSATSASYQPGNTINVTGTTTLYAVWEAAPAKDVQQTGEGTVTIRKRFVGAEMPASFLMVYDISNAKSGPFASDVIDFTPVSGSTTQYSATIKYPIWTFTGDWTDAEKAQYNSQIVLSELDADIQGKDLTITATGASVDNDAQTISFTVGASTLTGGTKVITNTYTSSVVPNKNLTGISKARMTSSDIIPSDINTNDYNLDANVSMDAGSSVNLLYRITITGETGANYVVTDEDATPVSGSLIGTITTGTSGVVYVSKSYSEADLVDGKAVNTATLAAGVGTTIPTGTSTESTVEIPVTINTPTPVDPTVDIYLQRKNAEGQWETVAGGPGAAEGTADPGETVRYLIRAYNPNNFSIGKQEIVNDMDVNLNLLEDTREGVLVVDGVPTPLQSDVYPPEGAYGTQQIWTIDDFGANGEVTITYEAVVGNTVAGIIKNEVNFLLQTGYRLQGRVDDAMLLQSTPCVVSMFVPAPVDDASQPQIADAETPSDDSGLGM